jgi:hypothetical protein
MGSRPRPQHSSAPGGEESSTPPHAHTKVTKTAGARDGSHRNVELEDAKEYCERAIASLKPCSSDTVGEIREVVATASDEDGNEVRFEMAPADVPILRPIGSGLGVSYLVDEGPCFSYVAPRHLAGSGLVEDELHRLGVRNLMSLVDAELSVTPYGSIFAAFYGGHFEASLLLVDELWDDSFRQFVSGDYVVAVPSRDVLAFADASDADAREELRGVIARVWPDGDHLVSRDLFLRRDGQWIAETH